MFKHPDGISDTLNKGIQLYIDRLDLDKRNRELFFDIIKFVFDEGKITGKEEYLREHREFTNQINKDDDKEQN